MQVEEMMFKEGTNGNTEIHEEYYSDVLNRNCLNKKKHLPSSTSKHFDVLVINYLQ